MAAKDDYPNPSNIEMINRMHVEIDRLRANVILLRTELDKHGWGDMHYGTQSRDIDVSNVLIKTIPWWRGA